MSENLPALRRFNTGLPATTDGGVAPLDVTGSGEVTNRISSRQLDQLVDLVVERIEARVIDELERRGRRTGGF